MLQSKKARKASGRQAAMEEEEEEDEQLLGLANVKQASEYSRMLQSKRLPARGAASSRSRAQGKGGKALAAPSNPCVAGDTEAEEEEDDDEEDDEDDDEYFE